MAHYNNNKNRYNGGRNKKQYNNYNNGYNNRPQNRPAEFNGFDATQYKKPDIEIKDLNGTVYKINGNFTSAFSAELLKNSKKIEEIRKGGNNIENFPEIYKLLREWCLSLLNQNTDGVTYSMDVVTRGFDDIYVLYNLLAYITKIVGERNPQRLMKND